MGNRFNGARPGGAAPAGGTRGLPLGAVAVSALLLMTGCGGDDRPGESARDRAAGGAGAEPAPGAGTAGLPQVTTYTSVKSLPTDADPFTAGDGTVVHPATAVPVSARPGGPAVATLPGTQLGGPTWVPVVQSVPGWHRVLLPSRPNRTTGWIPAQGLRTAHSSHSITVDLSSRRLTLSDGQSAQRSWTVAIGAPGTPTPTGRSFLLASLAPAKPTYSPLILPIGAHSATLDTFGGGPGTVAFHGWPTRSVFGKAVTHGCIRIPADALTRLSRVPLGTPVLITA